MLRLSDFLPYRLSITSNAVSEVLSGAYQDLFQLRIPEWRLIAVLGEQDDLTQNDLAARTLMDKMTVSRATAALVRRRLVSQNRDGADGRSRRLTLTTTGRELYGRVAPAALRLEAALLTDFSAEDRALLAALLGRLHDSAERFAADKTV